MLFEVSTGGKIIKSALRFSSWSKFAAKCEAIRDLNIFYDGQSIEQ